MHNLYQQFRQLLPDAPLQAGTVLEVGSGVVLVVLPGGGLIRARGNATVGQTVFVRDEVIEGIARVAKAGFVAVAAGALPGVSGWHRASPARCLPR